jgi:hypothetical protein
LQPDRATLLRRRLADAVERVAPQRLRIRLSQALLDLLPPPATPALALRGAEQGPTLLELTVAAAGEPVEQVDQAAYADRGSPDRCVLRLRLGLRGREWPDLADTPVTLRLGAEQRHALTDPWGEVVFEGLERARLPHLQVEVGAPASA